MLPELREDDIIAILDTGASGYSMASFYNGRPMPTEVLVDGNTSRVIRKKAEYSF
jgi:diaminopimelate decarboxylase